MNSTATQKKTQALSFSSEQEKILNSWTMAYPYPMMGLLEAMRQVQSWHLCVRPEDEEYLAEIFKTTRSHVHQIATFFPLFTDKPTGRKRIGLCHGISCAMAGSAKMAVCLEEQLGVKAFETTSDGEFSWEEMECLGACDHAPALIVNEELKGKATESLIAEIAGNSDARNNGR
jgi:NADH-quinone oxidoreductase subunit E